MKIITPEMMYEAFLLAKESSQFTEEDLAKIDIEDEDDIEDAMLKIKYDDRVKWANFIIENYLIEIQHGDAVHWVGPGYRNNNLLFWHREKKIIHPYIEIDDYGSVPPDFRVGNEADEFEPGHWIDDVDHNGIVFLSDSLMENIKSLLASQTGETVTCRFKIKGAEYHLEVEKDRVNNITNYLHYTDYYTFSF